GQDKDRPLPPPGLKPDDFACAVSLLNLPFVKQYVRCMRDAVRGQASGDCLKDLVGLAKNVGNGGDVLLANLQARAFSLASRNQEWRGLALGGIARGTWTSWSRRTFG